MKNTFKRMFAIFLTAFMLFLCVGCSINTKSIVKEINNNTNLEIKLLTKVDEDLFDENYEIIGGFGITGYFDKKYGENYLENSEAIDACSVIYHVTSYPDVLLGKPHVTGIEITDPAITFYGYSVGDNMEGVEAFFTKKGYDKFYDNGHLLKFNKGKVQIRIGVNNEEQTICSIYVGVDTTNCTGVVF